MTTPGFLPTHVVPPGGLPAWETPDPSRPTVPLDALLPVRLVDRRGDWGQILCANGWSAWVDGRLLVAVPQSPPVAGTPLTRTADPRPLLARVEEALARYRAEAEALAAGRLDGGSFRDRTKGLRIGVVVDGESLWLFDAAHERWVYCDGTRLSTFAVSEAPHEEPAPAAAPPVRAPEPTRVVREADLGPAEHGPTRVVREADLGPAEHGPTRQETRGHGPTEHGTGARTPTDDEPTRLVPPVTPDG